MPKARRRRRCRTRRQAGWWMNCWPKRSCAHAGCPPLGRRARRARLLISRAACRRSCTVTGWAVVANAWPRCAPHRAENGLVTDRRSRDRSGSATSPARRPGRRGQLLIGKLKGVGPVWQLTAVDTATRGRSRSCLGPSNHQIAARFFDRVRTSSGDSAWTIAACSPTTVPSSAPRFRSGSPSSRSSHHRTPPRSPNHNAVCERFQGTALQECWRPSFHRRRFVGSPNCAPKSTAGSHLQHPPTQSQRLHARPHPTPSPRHAPQEPSSMTITNRVQLSPQPVTRKA